MLDKSEDALKLGDANEDQYILLEPEATEGLNFSQALARIQQGDRLQRKGWNGSGMFVFLVPGSTFQVSRPPLLGIFPSGTTINYRPHIDIYDAQQMVGVWNPSQADLAATDWQLAGSIQKGPAYLGDTK